MNASALNRALFCFAHRGGLGYGPENSLPAIAKAIELGVDAVEIDVWKIDGELLITHDRRLGKTLPGRGLLQNQTARALREIKLPDNTPQVPTLREVLTLVAGRAELNIELKGPDCATAVAAELESFARDSGSNFDAYLISSFDHHQLSQFKRLLPTVRRGALIAHIPLDYARCGEALGAYSLHADLNSLNQALIDDAHRRGLKVFVYTVNEEDDMRLMASMKVDGVFTDYPERLLALNKN